jgi:trehalose-6-phosphatase
MQANDLQKHLIKVLNHPGVDVVKYNNSRILEVKPRGISKGNAAIAICEGLFVGGPFKFDFPSFFLGIGDDRADEEMFQTITQKGPWIEILSASGQYSSANDPQSFHRLNMQNSKVKETKERVDRGEGYLRDSNLFTVTVGMKPSQAKFYLNSHKEVLETLQQIAL